MAFGSNLASGSTAIRSPGFRISDNGTIADVQRWMEMLSEDLDDGMGAGLIAKGQASKFMRKESKTIAQQLVVPAVNAAARTPFEKAMAATARAKSDRIVVVKLGGVNPKISGYRRGTSARTRSALAFGAEYGPRSGYTRGKNGTYTHNPYGRGRNADGYFLGPRVLRNTALLTKVRARWNVALKKAILGQGSMIAGR